jgi:hypothetical protein
MVWACSTHGEKWNAYRVLVGKPQGKRPLGRLGHRVTIEINLREIDWDGMDWVHLAQDSDQWRPLNNMVMNLRLPYNVGNFLDSSLLVHQSGIYMQHV